MTDSTRDKVSIKTAKRIALIAYGWGEEHSEHPTEPFFERIGPDQLEKIILGVEDGTEVGQRSIERAWEEEKRRLEAKIGDHEAEAKRLRNFMEAAEAD